MNDIKNSLLALVNDETAFYEECARLIGIAGWEMEHRIVGNDGRAFEKFLEILKQIEVDPNKLPFAHSKWRQNGAMNPKEYCAGLHRFLTGKTIEKWKWDGGWSVWQNGRSSQPSDEEIRAMGNEEFFAYLGLDEVHQQLGRFNHLCDRPSWEERDETLIRSEYRDRKSWCISRSNGLGEFLRGRLFTIMF